MIRAPKSKDHDHIKDNLKTSCTKASDVETDSIDSETLEELIKSEIDIDNTQRLSPNQQSESLANQNSLLNIVGKQTEDVPYNIVVKCERDASDTLRNQNFNANDEDIFLFNDNEETETLYQTENNNQEIPEDFIIKSELDIEETLVQEKMVTSSMEHEKSSEDKEVDRSVHTDASINSSEKKHDVLNIIVVKVEPVDETMQEIEKEDVPQTPKRRKSKHIVGHNKRQLKKELPVQLQKKESQGKGTLRPKKPTQRLKEFLESLSQESLENASIETNEADIRLKKFKKWRNGLNNEQQVIEEHTLSEPKSFNCDLCDVKFTTKNNLTLHIRIHHKSDNLKSETGLVIEEKLLKCEICYKKFTYKYNLMRHNIRIHNKSDNLNSEAGQVLEDKSLKCELCDKKFIYNNNLKRHIKIHDQNLNSESVQVLKCDVCDKKFTKKTKLTYHLRYHHKSDNLNIKTGKVLEDIFKCELCYKKFTFKNNLRRHIKLHDQKNNSARKDNPIRKYLCNYCDKRFKDNFGLRRHLRVHSFEKPYICDYCSMRFNQKNNLVRHIRLHVGDKPYSCSFCEKRFTQKGDMKHHVRFRHTGERPFACEHCPCKFALKNCLKRHNLKYHS